MTISLRYFWGDVLGSLTGPINIAIAGFWLLKIVILLFSQAESPLFSMNRSFGRKAAFGSRPSKPGGDQNFGDAGDEIKWQQNAPEESGQESKKMTRIPETKKISTCIQDDGGGDEQERFQMGDLNG